MLITHAGRNYLLVLLRVWYETCNGESVMGNSLSFFSTMRNKLMERKCITPLGINGGKTFPAGTCTLVVIRSLC
jgi:hypothetical protein